MPRDDDNSQKGVRCSFCNKTQDQVDTLVAGPGVFICNECVELCREVIEDEDRPHRHGGGKAEAAFFCGLTVLQRRAAARCKAFCGSPYGNKFNIFPL